MEVPEARVCQALSIQPDPLHVGAPQLQEGVDALVTEVVHLVDVELLEAVTHLGDGDEAGGVEVAAVEEVELADQ